MSKCALCGQDKPLRKSHIISEFIFDYMKETSAVENTRFKRPLENINKVYQDGDKLPLLMRDYLFGQRSDLDYVENHIFFWDLIEDTSKGFAENNPNSFFRRTVYGYTTIMDGNSIYVQTNMMGIMAVTIIKKHKEDEKLRGKTKYS